MLGFPLYSSFHISMAHPNAIASCVYITGKRVLNMNNLYAVIALNKEETRWMQIKVDTQ